MRTGQLTSCYDGHYLDRIPMPKTAPAHRIETPRIAAERFRAYLPDTATCGDEGGRPNAGRHARSTLRGVRNVVSRGLRASRRHGVSNASVGTSTTIAPPSATSVAPVTNDASGDARNAHTAAISSGSAARRSGTSALTRA